MKLPRLVVLLPLLVPACDSHEPGLTDEPVEIVFEGRVGGAPFACGETYDGLGKDGASATPQDFRFYVHDVRLVTADGDEHPVTIEDDGVHQGGGVALIDFEDGSGACANGTPELHTTLKGVVAAQPRHGGAHGGGHEFVGLRFKIGVPQEQNHTDLTQAPAPLNDTTMSWSWNYGHIFFTAWGVVEADAPSTVGLHVGSIGCEGDAMAGEIVACANSNRPEIVLDGFDAATGKVAVDWGAVFSGLTLATPAAECEDKDGKTTCACHSFGPEALCSSMFRPLGLDWTSGDSTADQAIFRVQ
ncbi:MbnP family copper-binding protein [Nannocystis bainbridge]|uniref:Metallo-mystery pair system four-Cys motif protein n=1 Tax=Nannocystis bainbridge TaxID=2995303 RepID=A0ABT5E4Y9_9BACT|nr:MbnP family copper-binding protein [Nannocystis bainbridge]MDC0720919.1 metallo-mystery pair system four-Cys motif protein [Nannocystis bainbridge]